MDPSPAFETERLVLRPLAEGDFDALYAYESREDVARWLYWGPRSPDEVRERLGRKISARAIRAEGDVLSLAMTLRETGEMVGDIVLEFLSEEHRTGEIGYIVHPDHQGRGYATEASEAMLRFAFDEVGLHRVIGRTEARNRGSARTLEKLGMRLEAHLVENEWVKGEWQSELVYAILDREWRARHPGPPVDAGPGARALVITGLFGTGKSSVAVEVADSLEKRGEPYAVIDLDWLCWGYAGGAEGAEHRMMLANLRPVVMNYRAAGVRSFILARALRTETELEELCGALPMPVEVVRLRVPWDEIQRRLGADLTAARSDDLRDARAWIEAGHGEVGGIVVANDRPLAEVAGEVLERLGW
ncbi:MAG TPA: GNAT family protein [Actinomycetota bacterium]